jgi:hypothetical protein
MAKNRREAAEFADGHAYRDDLRRAKEHEQEALALERKATELEAAQANGYTVGEAHPAVVEPVLAACPFCGEASLDVIRPDGFPEGFPAMQVICRNPGCLCSGPIRPDRGEAISYWNARAELHEV